MNIEIQRAKPEEKSLLRRMLELYLYDFSEFSGEALNNSGEYGYNYLDSYWTEENRHPFLVRSDGELAGFVFVAPYAVTEDVDQTIAEFFILRKFRKQGIGRHVAKQIFQMYSGTWEVRTFRSNAPAIKFWTEVIGEVSNGQFKHFGDGYSSWGGHVWTFCINK